MTRSVSLLISTLFLLVSPVQADAFQADVEGPNSEPVARKSTAAEIQKVIQIGRKDSQVQAHLDVLTNRIGPRLTSSEGLQAACEWARDEFESMGLEARLEQWGEFPVGFERGPAYGMMVSPKKMKLEFGTNAWTAGTRGRDLGKAVLAPRSMEELEEMKSSIDGNYVLLDSPPRRRRRGRDQESENTTENERPALTREQYEELKNAIEARSPAGIIRSTRDNLILTGGNYRVDFQNLPTIPQITLLKEQFDEIKSMLAAGEDVQLAFDIRNHFRKGPIPLYNVIAEIPGTEWPEQRVVVGGHIDSWDGATGATDNAAGCATAIEAARLLMEAGVRPRRTIRFMLWSGEEQGLLGSRAHVEKNREEINKNVSAVFVHDGGTNYVAGINCTESMRPIFEEVFAEAMALDERAPFEINVLEAIRPRGGSDHVSYIRAGVPGFFWRQRGRATYRTTHHTQFDTFETVVPEYQQHSAIVIALGALGTANLDELLPRDGVQESN